MVKLFMMIIVMVSQMKILKAGKELQEYKKAHVTDRCPLCNREMKYVESRNQVVDHDHKTGMIRGILCRNCNGIEGKITNLCNRAGVAIKNKDFLYNLIDYWVCQYPTDIYYPGCKEVKGKIIPPKKKRRKRR